MDKNHNVGLLLALSFLLHISYLYAGTSYEAYEAAPQIVVNGCRWRAVNWSCCTKCTKEKRCCHRLERSV